jgi:hypothetical protein
VDEAALRHTELIFRARSRLGRGEIDSRLDPQEHHDLYPVPATQAGIATAIKDAMLTPVAVAALLLWGRGAFGEEWFAARVANSNPHHPRDRI